MSAANPAAGSAPIGRQLPPGALVRPNGAARSDEFSGTPSESPMQLAVRRLLANRVGMAAGVLLLLICALSFSGGWFEAHWSGRDAAEQNLGGTATIGGKEVEVVNSEGMPNIGPGLRREYTFGADGLGRDVFVRMMVGGSVSLRVGIGATALIIGLGTLVGVLGGYYGGRADKLLTYVVDVMIAFPFMIFAITLNAAIATSGRIGPISASSILVPTCIIGVLGCFGFSRIIRANSIDLGGKEYVEAARALGADDRRIMLRHIVPHLVPTIITYSGILLASTILGEAGLSFLGLGVQPPTPSWGNLIADGRAFYSTAWWIAGAGGLMVMLTVLSANLLGEALEEAFDHKGNR